MGTKAPAYPLIEEMFADLLAKAKAKIAEYEARLPEGAKPHAEALVAFIDAEVQAALPNLASVLKAQAQVLILTKQGFIYKDGTNVA